MAIADTPTSLQFQLTVAPQAADRRWHALLVQQIGGTEVQHEFDTPLELARHVARLSLPDLSGGGLR